MSDNNIKVIDLDGGEAADKKGNNNNKEPIEVPKEFPAGKDFPSSDEEESDEQETDLSLVESNEDETASDDDSNDDDSDSDSDMSGGSAASDDTETLLASDPLYYVMSRFLLTNDGTSIATIMSDISVSLKKIAKALRGIQGGLDGRAGK